MSKADEMFKKLGYELIEDSKRYLRYAKYDNIGNYKYSGKFIDFEKVNKEFRLTRKTHQGNTHFRYSSMQEIQAIIEKCKELRMDERIVYERNKI